MKKENTADRYYNKLPHPPICLPQLTWPFSWGHSTPWYRVLLFTTIRSFVSCWKTSV